ncbi:MAG: type IV-A pilus assembly ATPase PilB [Candidatus Eisenbacteria sp.]|nr:type IV-A pilus assembly ATPase PilB [Candidatus Eisenbacteria bacterium]
MRDRLGEVLLEAGLVGEDDVQQALARKEATGNPVAQCLLEMEVLSEEDLCGFLTQRYRVPTIDLENVEIDDAAVQLVPVDVARKFRLIPVSVEGRRLTLAMADPGNYAAVDDIKFITGLEVRVAAATDSAISRAIDRHCGEDGESLAEIVKDMADESVEVLEAEEEDDGDAADSAQEAPIVKFVNSLIADAVRKGVSDIHIEPYEKTLRVRFRIDGTLFEVMSPPVKMKSAIISRLKIMSDLDIAERRVAQDGRIKIKVLKRTVDLRVSTLPTLFGEKVVMRILDQSNLNMDLEKFGFGPKALKDFLEAIESPYGMILVTGPTGSGKTTTLYSAMSRLNVPDVNIMTAEDPVEYNLDGINQVLVNEEVGVGFAAALRAFLRQDPDIIMVGEIRDLETGSIATKAALTGHLVLSTLHTNDAPSTIDRLIDMGLERFLVASAVNLVLAQRLVRRICSNCKEEYQPEEALLQQLDIPPEELGNIKLFKGSGCPQCNGTGYSGRVGLYEAMPVTARIRHMILEGSSSDEIRKAAIEEGMLTLRDDAVRKMKSELTTITEVLGETTR